MIAWRQESGGGDKFFAAGDLDAVGPDVLRPGVEARELLLELLVMQIVIILIMLVLIT